MLSTTPAAEITNTLERIRRGLALVRSALAKGNPTLAAELSELLEGLVEDGTSDRASWRRCVEAVAAANPAHAPSLLALADVGDAHACADPSAPCSHCLEHEPCPLGCDPAWEVELDASPF